MPHPVHVVWFKRDLRTQDHAPLSRAAASGPVLPLYIVEPDLWQQPDLAGRHWGFIRESLDELQTDLAALGLSLTRRYGEALTVLESIRERCPIAALWSHQETGNRWTYDRDRRVADWCRAYGIPWYQPPQHAVIRGRVDRNRWSRAWERFMGQPQVNAPGGAEDGTPIDWQTEANAPVPEPPLAPDPCPGRQAGGRQAGRQLLESFLRERGQSYHRGMSSPNTAYTACSRLSPHFAWGTLSLREVVQATRARQADLGREAGEWVAALKAFEGRLHWHCHFIQKLESEPRLEFENLQSACDGLRESAFDAQRLAAWVNGTTGFPFVDACMRALRATGWINFRMRAMLVSVASYHLWLHWREPALHLARCFTDYEPGIHYSQMQMQSGTTGINALRIYNPIKQGRDQDPDGHFIRAWVPELAGLEDRWLHEPNTAPPEVLAKASIRLGVDYPYPLVDAAAAAQQARRRLGRVRAQGEARTQSRGIYHKHGSRRRRLGRSHRGGRSSR
jgi:deoxyribodipyrimidine photo-lyase